MAFEKVDLTDNRQIICNMINRIKSLRHITNCYSTDVVEKSVKVWELNESFVFSYNDHGIKRIIYFVKNYTELNRLLSLIKDGTYYLEFMTKNPDDYIPENSSLTARMMRMSNPDCRDVLIDSPVLRYMDESIGDMAKEEDAGEINQLLWNVFHTEISHLLTDDELSDSIRRGQVTIHRSESIDAVLQVDVMPKKFYINQVVNQTDRNIIHAMLLNRLQKYVDNGGRYMYAWVEDKNTASLKFHQKYGMKHDGMWSMIYRLER